MVYVAGIDIGGTKCAVTIGSVSEEGVAVADKIRMETPATPQEAVPALVEALKELTKRHPDKPIAAVGVSCGGPLDSKKGLILSPPNLKSWDRIDICTPFEQEFGVPCALQNDANACGLAEWLWGAGKGTENMIFLTFGTGMGAGLILNGRLYAGTNDMAGEAGHMRLEADGPEGYYKKGSFEGFCSGGGIARLAKIMLGEYLAENKTTKVLKLQPDPSKITARDLGIAANEGDEFARKVYETVGEKLGKGLAVLIDILNPEKIVIGSIFLRQEQLLRPAMEKAIRREALSDAAQVCEIVPAGLKEEIGDYAALSVGYHHLLRSVE